MKSPKKTRTERTEFRNWLHEQQQTLPPSALRYILESIVPYTEANTKLVFRPNAFFNELDARDHKRNYALATLKKAFYEAKQRELIIDRDGMPQLSELGLAALRPYEPTELDGAEIMIIFDIPEDERYKRYWLRLLLHELKFVQVQKSVWRTKYDCRDLLYAGLSEQGLWPYVELFQARRLELT